MKILKLISLFALAFTVAATSLFSAGENRPGSNGRNQTEEIPHAPQRRAAVQLEPDFFVLLALADEAVGRQHQQLYRARKCQRKIGPSIEPRTE